LHSHTERIDYNNAEDDDDNSNDIVTKPHPRVTSRRKIIIDNEKMKKIMLLKTPLMNSIG